MTLKSFFKDIVKSVDRLSPHPFFYPFRMSNAEIMVFEEEVKKSKHYLEFGLGGSTLRAIQKSNAMIYTVESSSEWLEFMRKYIIIKYFEKKRLSIFLVNIGPTGDWGYPKSDVALEIFEKYSSGIFDVIGSGSIDLALIDGRFRVACTLKLILECHENSSLRILIHDFWDREQYHIVLKYLNTLRRVDTLGFFSIADNVDIEAVRADYEAYKLNPE
ncbi:hypothetical protein [Marinobacter sp.]|uniref:hypothetical protein n=1 Tax=Marinobacter sp. TaxID=50741 RepID=UPI003A91B80C